jgi:DNA invertase Pin-like site-specific DNA recombinase
MNDKAAKGRTLGFASMKGEDHTQAKLTEEDVVVIKTRLRGGHKQKQIAKDFGVDSSVISRISTGKIWKDVCI